MHRCQYFTYFCVQLSARAFKLSQHVISMVLRVFLGHPKNKNLLSVIFVHINRSYLKFPCPEDRLVFSRINMQKTFFNEVESFRHRHKVSYPGFQSLRQ